MSTRITITSPNYPGYRAEGALGTDVWTLHLNDQPVAQIRGQGLDILRWLGENAE